MAESFIYNIPTKVYFGKNQLEHLKEEAPKYGKNVLLCYGGGSIKKIGLYDEIINLLSGANMNVFELSGIAPNPRVTSANEGAKICKEHHIDLLLAVGGGSVIDLTKLISAAAFYDGDAWDIVLRKTPITKCLPIMTVLTLAATGSEMDKGGVISNEQTKDKLGVGSPLMLPKVSFLDPTLTYTVSPYQTACGSADIFSHIIETYFVPRDGSMYMLDCFKEGLMKTVIKYAPIAVKEPTNYEARENLMWTSSWAINGFSSGKQNCAWSCHPIEHELSAIYDITHGLGLAILTPRWMKHILSEKTVFRFYQYGVNVFGIDSSKEPMVVAKEAIQKTEEFLFEKLGLKSHLKDIGIDETYIPLMAKKACKGNSSINGFVQLTPEDIEEILKASL